MKHLTHSLGHGVPSCPDCNANLTTPDLFGSSLRQSLWLLAVPMALFHCKCTTRLRHLVTAWQVAGIKTEHASSAAATATVISATTQYIQASYIKTTKASIQTACHKAKKQQSSAAEHGVSIQLLMRISSQLLSCCIFLFVMLRVTGRRPALTAPTAGPQWVSALLPWPWPRPSTTRSGTLVACSAECASHAAPSSLSESLHPPAWAAQDDIPPPPSSPLLNMLPNPPNPFSLNKYSHLSASARAAQGGGGWVGSQALLLSAVPYLR